MIVSKRFSFEAAHNLLNYVGKCKDLHGHTFQLEVAIEGNVNSETDMILDFKILKQIVTDEVIEALDHKYLNDVVAPINPTAENLIVWIWNRIEPKLRTLQYSLKYIRLWETPTSMCEYSGK